jgi:hypothetical protein
MTFFPSSHDRELELLSAYLDNQLGPAERARLERRLAQEPQLQATLDDLRMVKVRLVALPKVKPPRNFTLTPKLLEARGHTAPRPLPRLLPLVNLATALAAVLFAVLITADLRGSFNLAAPAPQVESFQVAEAPAAEAQAVESASADAAIKSTTPTPEIGAFLAPPEEPAEPLSGEGGPGAGGGGVGTTNTGPATDTGVVAEAAPLDITGTAEATVAPPEAVAQSTITETPTPDSSRSRVTTEVPLVTQEATETLAQTPPVVRVAEIALGLTVILLITASLFLRRR